MTPQTLAAHLKSLGLSAGGFARLVGVHKRTVERYLSGDVEIPGPVERLARIAHNAEIRRHLENKSLYSDKMS
jgi:transcriptional regulator with XRE-family HTH domain